ncbi:molybdopterin converting factor subunit 1 [Devosia rhodophyticola]|uniref:Molybdopterin converting factor subunit 1 n=1 Tax=Devosia rhodophyticola TaxID=3026423 RepID=A0ABY7YW48_9HYPH|nr:molybdopterin converting factor subunit 1 [Devosia rhodophyticola]WDR05085.1 molybdopterin converting factor subunit 1 [Devosia rhodophyticola]
MNILYFAWLRERLDRSQQQVEPPEHVKTVADLIDWLAQNDEAIALAFENRKLIRAAVNAQIVDHDAPIADAHTIAFFPPMTGG